MAERLMSQLRSKNIDASLASVQLRSGVPILAAIRDAITASSYFVILLSQQSISSEWVAIENDLIFDELRKRDITILPVLLENCLLPSSLAGYQYFDMHDRGEEATRKLSEALRLATSINFEALSVDAFESLVGDLLAQLGFEGIKSRDSRVAHGADFVAEYRHKDPFGGEVRERYVIETKLYTRSRASVRTLHELVGYAAMDPTIDRALLITTSKPTSVALEWAREAEKTSRIPIRIIDGTELKRLLLHHSELIVKYFFSDSTRA